MKTYLLLFVSCAVLADSIDNASDWQPPHLMLSNDLREDKQNVISDLTLKCACRKIPDSIEFPKEQRGAAGALHILTNHAQPIHADVKPESANEIIEKPCKDKNLPSPIEPGIVFQVIPPTDTTYEQKSLRKSLPLTNKLDVIRSVTRITTLIVLIVSAVLEFYPMLQLLYYIAYGFIYLK